MGGSGSKWKYLKQENPINNWQMLDDLGSGTYGKVCKVRHRSTGQVAAAKVAALQREEQLADFAVEVSILATHRHENITNFFDGYYHDNNLWILIECCAGGALGDVIRKRKMGFDELCTACITHQVLCGLEYLHARFVIHRDINASNILLADGGIVKLADFGVSAKCKNESQRHSSFIGTPHWMAPEVVACENKKGQTYFTEVDIWSYGITVIELLEMIPPNNDLHPMKVLFKIAAGAPPTLADPSKVSAECNDFLRTCLVKDQFQRPTATALLGHPFSQRGSAPRPLADLLQKLGVRAI